MGRIHFISLWVMLGILSSCTTPVNQPIPTPFPEITNTPKIVIKIGPPGESGEIPKNPFEGTPLAPVQGRSPTDPPQTLSLEGQVVDVAMIDHMGLPAVEATINGTGPYRFVVDWGANVFAMSPTLAVELGLPILGVDEMGNPNARVETVSIGGATFTGLTAALDPFFLQTAEDGVLGRNVYEGLLMTLDYPAGKIRLQEGELEKAAPSTIAYLPSEGGAPMVEVLLQDQRFNAVLDTGATRGLIIPASDAGKFTFSKGPVIAGAAAGPQLGVAETQRGRLDGDLAFAGHTVIQPIAEILDRPEYLLGSGLLKYFVITLDQGQKLVRLEREETTPIVVPPEDWESEPPSP